jgi:Flp pilus assembly protein TadB
MDSSFLTSFSFAALLGIGIFFIFAAIKIPTKSLLTRIREDEAGPRIGGVAESTIFRAFFVQISKRLRPYSGDLDEMLRRSGWKFESEIHFHSRRILTALMLMFLFILLGIGLNVVAGLSLGFLPIAVFSVLGAVLGFLLPDIELNRALQKRQTRLKKEMGFGLDQIYIFLQSGADLTEALSHVSGMGIFGKACETIANQVSAGETISTVTDNVRKTLPETAEFDEFLKLLRTGLMKGEAVQEPFRERAASMRQMLVRHIIEEGHKARLSVTLLTIVFMLVAVMIVTIVPITLLLFENAL